LRICNCLISNSLWSRSSPANRITTMGKLFFIPLMLLLLNCSNSNNGHQSATEQEDMEQPISIGGNAQLPEAGDTIGAEELTQEQVINIEQGIAGKIIWESGNQMPSPDAPRSTGRRGVKRAVYIYGLTNGTQATTTEGVFHANIQTKLITQVESDANGYFEVSLAPGRYSIFTKEEQGLYANLFDGENNIFPVEVKKEQVTTVEFLINYAATY